jgi:uncharacterized protein (TIGR03118 family)
MATGAWSGTKAPSGTEEVTPTATGTLTYSLVCSGGGYGESSTRSATLTVNPAAAFTRTMLVAGFAGSEAIRTDEKLVNPRGIAFAPGAPARIASRGQSIEFDGSGKASPRSSRIEIRRREAAGGFDPTAIVAVPSVDPVLAATARAAGTDILIAALDGTIRGAPRDADAGGMVMLNATEGAAFTGLTLASDETGTFLLAADFGNRQISVFDAKLERLAARASGFEDPTLPQGFAPFGIQAVALAGGATRIFVTFAHQGSPGAADPAVGPGLGVVSAFDTRGRFLGRVATGGVLNAPWGIALAPDGFGGLGKALLVGNVGDGAINAFDAESGRLLGIVGDVDGRPIATPGLRGIAFGNGSHGQPRTTLFFTASTDAADGVFGRIDPGLAPPLLDGSD